MNRSEQLQEYAKCLADPVYAVETYLETFDQTQSGYVPFQLFPKQKELVHSIFDNRFTIVTKPRQAGITTTTAACMAIKVSFYGDASIPDKILILANRQEIAQEFLKKIKEFLEQIPRWVWGIEYVEDPKKSIFLTDSKKHIILPTKCEVKALATSKDALRGFTPTTLVMDEAAYIENGSDVYGAALPSLGTGGKSILISTPNGYDDLYYKIYDGAVNKRNKYNVVEMRWYQDLRYNKGLRWLKGEEVVIEEMYNLESYNKMVSEGYKPTSQWYEDMCAEYNGDTRKIAQELDVSFLGSGGNVIDDEYVEAQNKENVMLPIRTEGHDNGVWIWKDPELNHQYIMGSDVSRGDSEDFSSIEIIDFETKEQVLEYQGKIPPDVLAELVQHYGDLYKAYTVVDITGGMGVTTVLKLEEMEYKRLHYDDAKSKILSARKDISKYKKYDNKIPGFNVGANRLPMVAEFERSVRQNDLIVRSSRLISEMKTFVYKNGRPDHMDGYHDDLLMAVAMCLWVLQTSFKNLEKVNEQTKAILNSWVTSTNLNTVTNVNVTTTTTTVTQTPVPSNIPNGEHMWLLGGMR
jgi:hypothetical protein